MKKILFILITGLGFLSSEWALASSTLPDSVGIETKDGKRYILHRVDQGQTLFGIARRYKTTVQMLKETNPELAAKDAVQYDQLVRIPLPDLSRKEVKAVRKEEKAKEKVAKTVEKVVTKPATPPAEERAEGIHIVETGQTLFSLSVRYDVLMRELRHWNNLPDDNIKIGQALIVSEKAYQLRQPSAADKAAVAEKPAVVEKPVTKPEPTKPVPFTVAEKTEKPAPKPTPVEKPTPKPTETRTTATPSNHPAEGKPLPTTGKRIADIGMAEEIDGNNNSSKYLALHRSAPIGTLVQVRNDATNQSLYVKVIGRLPDTGVNDRVLIKLSAKAFEKLSPNGQRFRAEVSYVAQ